MIRQNLFRLIWAYLLIIIGTIPTLSKTDTVPVVTVRHIAVEGYVNSIALDSIHNMLWCATDSGLFSVTLPDGVPVARFQSIIGCGDSVVLTPAGGLAVIAGNLSAVLDNEEIEKELESTPESGASSGIALFTIMSIGMLALIMICFTASIWWMLRRHIRMQRRMQRDDKSRYVNDILHNKPAATTYHDATDRSSAADYDDGNHKFITTARAVIGTYYRDPTFDVGRFASIMGISRSLLNRKLRATVSTSAVNYIRAYRMYQSMKMIEVNRTSHEMNISEIAYKVGFNDAKYFTRCFTRLYGVAPSAAMAGEKAENTQISDLFADSRNGGNDETDTNA